MLTGYNHNVKYKGRVFHVQTEDSGEKNPLIITHLFDGGDIIASKKVDYQPIVGKPMFETQVQQMMEQQHKTMLKELLGGVLDELIEGHDAAVSRLKAPPAHPRKTQPQVKAPVEDPEKKVPVQADTVPAPRRMAEPAVARSKPADAPQFGSALISDKSFDQVILDFLDDKKEPGGKPG